MTALPPFVVIFSGTAGAGRTTAASHVLPNELGLTNYVDAGLIARGLAAFAPQAAATAARRLMLARLRDLAARRVSFSFEATLGGRSLAPWLAGLRHRGYRIAIIYLTTVSPEINIARLAGRISEESAAHLSNTHARGPRTFHELYRPLADDWRIYDTSAVPRLVDAAVHRTCPSLISRKFRSGTPIDYAMRDAVRHAVVLHKKLGNRVAIARQGRLKFLAAESYLRDFPVTPSAPTTSA